MFGFDPRFNPALFPPDQLVNSQGMPYSRSLLNMPQDQKDAVARSMAYIKAAQRAGNNPYAVGSAPQDQDYGGGSDPVPTVTTAPAGLSTGGAIPARGTPEREALKNLIYHYESMGGQNVPNYRFDPTHTAQGIGQITNSTWRDVAQTDPIVGQFSNAMSAPIEVQDRAVDDLIDKRGVSPWAPYNPKLAAALEKSGFKTGLGQKNMLPAFGNSRLLAQLMPQGASGSTTDAGPLDAATATGGLYNTPAPGAGADPTDTIGQLQNLLKAGSSYGLGYNPQKLLASMAAGFLGGKGPAQSLAGGFGGAASSTKDDTAEQMGLMKMAMMYGPVLQQQIEQKKLSNAAAMTRTGAVGMGTALRLNGLDPQKYGTDEKTLNDQTFSDKPLPASSQKQIDTNLQSISTVREQKAILTSLQDEVKNGTFKPDALHMKFLYPAQAAAGNPLGDPGVVAWQKWNAASHALSNEILRGNAGVQTDADAKQAMDILTGGGITSADQFNQHVNFLTNRGALAEQKNKFLVDNIYKNSKKGKFDWDAFEQTLPGSPSVATPKDIGQNPYGDLNVGRPTAAPVGNTSGALPTATGSNGQKIVFKNGAWVPLP